MANYVLLNSNVDTIPIKGLNVAGDMVPLPVGMTPTLTNSDPASMAAVITGTDLVINALVRTATVTLNVRAGTLEPYELVVSIETDMTAVGVTADLDGVTHASQPIPDASPTPTPTPTPTP